MRYVRRSITLLLIAVFLPVIFTSGAAAEPSLTITPNKTILTPALIKEPILVTGSGWEADESIVVNLKVPEGVIVKGNPPGEDVGIAAGQADETGSFSFTVDSLTIIMTFFQADWDNAKMKPDFSKATPLPPGDYTVEAIGFSSDARVTSVLTLLPPPEKK